MTPFTTQGWLPLDIKFDPQPSVVTAASVRWMDFGVDPLAEPFFWQTVEKIQEGSASQQIDTSLEGLFRIAGLLPAVRPAGLIFHISHCGSTLVANALRAAPSTLVAAEAMPFVRLARWYPESDDPYLRARWTLTRSRLFEALFTLYGNHRAPEAPQRLVLKFSSLNLFGLKFIRRCWPEIPCVVMVRDPIDVLVSTLSEAGWLAYKLEPGPQELYGWTDAPRPFNEMPDEEFCARLLGRHLAAAVDGVDAGCKVIDYEDLNPNRIAEIARFFGIELPADPKGLDGVFHVYSKDPAKAIPFQDDRHRKRRLASKTLQAAAREFAMPDYVELRSRGAL